MDLKQLRYFQQVAQQGSYTRAADILGVAQPVLSRQIRLLETELRQNLLNRHGRGVSLTESGRILLEHCRVILQQVEMIQEDLSLNSGKLSGHITLGLPPTIAKLLSLPIIRGFRQHLPDARLRITEGLSAQLQDRLQQGKINMALLYNPAYSAEVETQLLYEERLYLTAPKNDPLLKADTPVNAEHLAALPLIMPSVPNTFRLLVEQEMARHNLVPNIVMEIDSVETMLQLVAEGMGYSILSKYSIDLMNHKESVQVIPIESPQFVSRLFLATSARHALTRTQKEVDKLLKKVCLNLVEE
ncbi:LysR family transcriptional regulator [Neisseria sp. CCUG12390]|uniref:LysR family transcriptional regulator n=1 Tax=Neisseria sp. CCUG12390 TaxID=3392035 RepID=UPI003A0FC550